jgi:hypothetical protein
MFTVNVSLSEPEKAHDEASPGVSWLVDGTA